MTRNVALIYVRVSRLDSEDRKRHVAEGDDAKLRAISPATQIEQCRALPALRGMQVEVLEDLHRSGKTTKRPGLDRLRERIHEGDVAVIAVWSITRLGRSVVDLYQLLGEFEKADVAFVSAKESIDTSTAYGRAFVGILSVLAQMERELTSERLAANWEQMAHEGRLVGPLPTGYIRDESRAVVIDPEPAAIVRTLFGEYATGNYSFRSLAVWANERNLVPPQQDRGHVGRRGEQLGFFTVDSIRDLLSNMRYAGRFVHKRRQNPLGVVVEGEYPAIVTPEVWQACNAIRLRNRRAQGRGDRRVTSYALSGLVVCGNCGDNVRSKPNRARSVYLCRSRDAAGKCDEARVDTEALENEVRDWLRSIRVLDEWRAQYATDAAAPAKRNGSPSIAQRRRAIESKLERMRVSWEVGARTDEAAYRDEVATLRRELEGLSVVREQPTAAQGRTLTTLVDRWDEMDAGQRRRLVSTVFQEITMKGGRVETAKPHPDWLPFIERSVGAGAAHLRGWWESNPRHEP